MPIGAGAFLWNNTCDGANYSPDIRIEGLDAPYLALIMDDIDAPSGVFTHWVIFNVPKTDHIQSNIPKRPDLDNPFSARQGMNTFGKVGYDGPCPPKGRTHRYFARVYGLTSLLDIPSGSTRDDVEKAMQGKVKQYGEAMATYGR